MKRKRIKAPKRLDVPLDELRAIVERASSGALDEADRQKLLGAVDTLAFVTSELEQKGASINRLRRLLFGPSTEKTDKVTPNGSDEAPAKAPDAPAAAPEKKKRKGHGRNGAADFEGAHKIGVPLGTPERGQVCPECNKGKVYPLLPPATLIRVTGMAPLSATVYELERRRCNLCGQVFTASAPEGVGDQKYDESAATMIALLKYGSGFPFHRLERLLKNLGIPLPAGTQWELVLAAADEIEPAFDELIRQAAQGRVVHNDDTTMKILQIERPPDLPEDGKERKGVFTTGIVSIGEGRQIAVFQTGNKHAGENLADMLKRRAAEHGPPIQMSDGLAANTAGDFETLVAECIAHARRRFVDVADNFPDECRTVLELLREVYANDALTREQAMSDDERLAFHQARSKPVMDKLHGWLDAQFKERKVEPNSSLGDAIQYMLKHWEKLTLFLRVPGAPLDNNICERALKKAILHRKNALFYKTENGARVGDIFMSLIHTAELCGANPFDYLVALQRHADPVARAPADWMPWSFRQTAARLAGAEAAPRP